MVRFTPKITPRRKYGHSWDATPPRAGAHTVRASSTHRHAWWCTGCRGSAVPPSTGSNQPHHRHTCAPSPLLPYLGGQAAPGAVHWRGGGNPARCMRTCARTTLLPQRWRVVSRTRPRCACARPCTRERESLTSSTHHMVPCEAPMPQRGAQWRQRNGPSDTHAPHPNESPVPGVENQRLHATSTRPRARSSAPSVPIR